MKRDANVRTNESINFETISSVEMAHNPIFIWLVNLCLHKVKEEGVEGVMVFKHNGIDAMIFTIRSSRIVLVDFTQMEVLSLREATELGRRVAPQVILEYTDSGISDVIVNTDKGRWRRQVAFEEVQATNVANFTTAT